MCFVSPFVSTLGRNFPKHAAKHALSTQRFQADVGREKMRGFGEGALGELWKCFGKFLPKVDTKRNTKHRPWGLVGQGVGGFLLCIPSFSFQKKIRYAGRKCNTPKHKSCFGVLHASPARKDSSTKVNRALQSWKAEYRGFVMDRQRYQMDASYRRRIEAARKGGRSRSKAKMAAVAHNLEAARVARGLAAASGQQECGERLGSLGEVRALDAWMTARGWPLDCEYKLASAEDDRAVYGRLLSRNRQWAEEWRQWAEREKIGCYYPSRRAWEVIIPWRLERFGRQSGAADGFAIE